MKTLRNISFAVAILFLAVTSCENLRDTYNDFVKDGEIIYVGKADSIKTRGGRKRIEISWLLLSDPNVSQYKIFWNNGEKSEEGFVQKTIDVDTVKVMFENMDEDTYQFDIILYDRDGHSSIKASTLGKVYGERYQASLLNRAYRSVSRINSRDILIEWMRATEDIVKVEIEYMDRTDVLRQLVLPAADSIITVADFPIDGTLKYRTAFIPETAALDTFYTSYQTIADPFWEIELNRSLWQNAKLSDDTWVGQYSPTWDFSNLWVAGPEPFYYTNTGQTFPIWATIDLGAQCRFTKLKYHQMNRSASDAGWQYNGGAPQIFEIWATNNPTTNWEDWTFLETFESNKPSDLPIGQLSDADRALITAGEDFMFAPMTEFYRYFRIKFIKTWGDATYVCFSEIRLWGQVL